MFKKPGIDDISNDLMRGMSAEVLSLQQLNQKIKDVENGMNLKLQGVQPAIDNLSFIWRALQLGFIGAIIIAALTSFLTFVLPIIRSAVNKPPIGNPTPQQQAPPSRLLHLKIGHRRVSCMRHFGAILREERAQPVPGEVVETAAGTSR